MYLTAPRIAPYCSWF